MHSGSLRRHRFLREDALVSAGIGVAWGPPNNDSLATARRHLPPGPRRRAPVPNQPRVARSANTGGAQISRPRGGARLPLTGRQVAAMTTAATSQAAPHGRTVGFLRALMMFWLKPSMAPSRSKRLSGTATTATPQRTSVLRWVIQGGRRAFRSNGRRKATDMKDKVPQTRAVRL